MLWNVALPAPMSVLTTFSAVPVVDAIVLPAPVTSIVPLVAASKPLPLVVVMSRPPPVKLSVWPSLPLITSPHWRRC